MHKTVTTSEIEFEIILYVMIDIFKSTSVKERIQFIMKHKIQYTYNTFNYLILPNIGIKENIKSTFLAYFAIRFPAA